MSKRLCCEAKPAATLNDGGSRFIFFIQATNAFISSNLPKNFAAKQISPPKKVANLGKRLSMHGLNHR